MGREVCRRSGIERELASKVIQTVESIEMVFTYGENDEHRMA